LGKIDKKAIKALYSCRYVYFCYFLCEVKQMLQLKEQYIINDKGQPTSVIITKKNYDRLVEYIEELEDIAAYDKVKKDRSKALPWDMVKR